MAIPTGIDLSTLITSINSSQVFVQGELAEDTTFISALRGSAQQAALTLHEQDGSVGVVVLDFTPQPVADLRDMARDVRDATGYSVVIVRAPGGAGTSCNTLSRVQIEKGEGALLANPDYVAGVQDFAAAAATRAPDAFPWAEATGGAVLLALVVMFTAFRRTLKS